MPTRNFNNDKKVPPKGFGTPHIYFDVTSSGYQNEGCSRTEKTRIAFEKDKYMLERDPNPCLGEIKEDAAGQYLVPFKSHQNRWQEEVPSNMKQTMHGRETDTIKGLINPTDIQDKSAQTLQSRITLDQMKERRKAVESELRRISLSMALNEKTRERATENLEVNLPEPVYRKVGLKSTLMRFPALRTKSSLPRIPGNAFA